MIEKIRLALRARRTPKMAAGFTLIEFVVIITIFSIMAGVGLFNFRGFQTDVGVNNLAHDIALQIKNVQTVSGAALSDQESVDAEQDTVPVWQGIVFPYENGGFLPEFSSFIDTDADGFYRENVDVVLDTIRVQSEDFISGVEYQSGGGGWTAYDDTLSFSFRRPFPEVGNWSIRTGDVASVRIIIESRDGKRKRAVVVSKIGAISVEPVQE